jgi:hypothetical protein
MAAIKASGEFRLLFKYGIVAVQGMVYINVEDGRAGRGDGWILWGCLGTLEMRGRPYQLIIEMTVLYWLHVSVLEMFKFSVPIIRKQFLGNMQV